MNGFTEGPWDICLDLEEPFPIAVVRKGTMTICNAIAVGKMESAELAANGYLLRAAPDLFAACEEAHQALVAFPKGPPPESIEALADRLLAALVRARGGSI